MSEGTEDRNRAVPVDKRPAGQASCNGHSSRHFARPTRNWWQKPSRSGAVGRDWPWRCQCDHATGTGALFHDKDGPELEADLRVAFERAARGTGITGD